MRHFRIPRDIFSSPGDSPNYFSLGFAHFFSTPNDTFPGLDRQMLLRPPSILPPSVPNRSGEVFADILRLLQGYDADVVVRDENHRMELLRDARYFHLKGVEQRLLPSSLSFNLLRQRSEIVLRLEDIRQSGVGFVPDPESSHVFNPPVAARDNASSKPATPLSTTQESFATGAVPTGFISYQRLFIDDAAADLVIEVSGPAESIRLDLVAMRATFFGEHKARIASLFQVIANKLNLPAMVPLGLMLLQSGGGVAAQPVSPANSGVSGDRVRVRIECDSHVEVNGKALEWGEPDSRSPPKAGESRPPDKLPPVKRWARQQPCAASNEELDDNIDWIVRRGHWRLRVEPSKDDPAKVEVVLCAVKLEVHTDERLRNASRAFLS